MILVVLTTAFIGLVLGALFGATAKHKKITQSLVEAYGNKEAIEISDGKFKVIVNPMKVELITEGTLLDEVTGTSSINLVRKEN